jgi:DNA recombination protein RmuC
MDLILPIILALCAVLAAALVTALLLRRRGSHLAAELAAATAGGAAAQRERDAAIEARIAAVADAASARAENEAMRQRLTDFERLQRDMLTAAKAAVTDTAAQVSSKLLDDHKRESEAQRVEAEERVRAASESLMRQVSELGQAVTVLNDKVGKTGGSVETLMRALSSPGGAGQYAEIGLANMLVSLGLESGRDYLLQASVTDEETGKRLRPDAVVFLPTDTVLVIDCKASKFVLEIAEQDGTEHQARAYENLARTMNQHLKSLSEKDYRNAVLTICRQSGRGNDPHIISLMYLPSEAALERLNQADRDFYRRARAAQIIPAGPAGLHSALLIASAEIRRLRQMENQREIVERCGALLESVAIVLSHAVKLGGGLKTAVDYFARLTGSINTRLLPRAQKLASLGILPKKTLPLALPTFSVQTGEDPALIEAESAELDPAGPRLLE